MIHMSEKNCSAHGNKPGSKPRRRKPNVPIELVRDRIRAELVAEYARELRQWLPESAVRAFVAGPSRSTTRTKKPEATAAKPTPSTTPSRLPTPYVYGMGSSGQLDAPQSGSSWLL
ncbi:hypothetical protein GCM10009800_01870 [Nocardiopsis rhodophaea]